MTAYDEGLAVWLQHQAAAVRAGQWDAIDRENLAEEVESVAREQKGELRQRLSTLWACLLCLYSQPTGPHEEDAPWADTISYERIAIPGLLEDSPSLSPNLAEPAFLARAWTTALVEASKESGIALALFPQWPLWTIEQTLDVEHAG